jgi:SAM-dependent methyltransferase
VTGLLGGEHHAERYDRLTLPFVQQHTPLLDAGAVVPDAGRVLDHGAGTGEVSLEVHRRFPRAAVTAVDTDARLLDRLRVGRSNAEWLQVLTGTVDTVDVGVAVDVVFSQLVLSLTTDPAHELRALRGLMRPRGLLRAAVVGGPERMRAFAGFWAAAEAVVPGAAPAVAYPHPRFADSEMLRGVAVEAGWADARVEPADTRRTVASAQLWEWLSLTLLLYTADRRAIPLHDLGSALVEQLRLSVLSQFQQFRDARGWFDVPTGGWLLTATAG